MKKMLISGCSHSAGIGLTNLNKSWGNIFAKNNNYELTNVSHPASSLQYSIHQIINKIAEEKFDVIILQLTTLNRYPITYNGENVFLTNSIKNLKDPEVFHLVEADYLQSIGIKQYGYIPPISNEIINFFYEKVCCSSFYLDIIINEIYLLQQLLKNQNIDFILVPYDDFYWRTDSVMSIWNYKNSKKIDKTRYIDYPFMQWLKDNYNSDDFWIDNGFHLNENGHKLFAEEYLPSFIKIN